MNGEPQPPLAQAQSQYEILRSANALVFDVIIEIERILNTPSQEWTNASRKFAMQGLRAKATRASIAFSGWIEQNVSLKNIRAIGDCLEAIGIQARVHSFSNSRKWGNVHLKDALQRLTT